MSKKKVSKGSFRVSKTLTRANWSIRRHAKRTHCPPRKPSLKRRAPERVHVSCRHNVAQAFSSYRLPTNYSPTYLYYFIHLNVICNIYYCIWAIDNEKCSLLPKQCFLYSNCLIPLIISGEVKIFVLILYNSTILHIVTLLHK